MSRYLLESVVVGARPARARGRSSLPWYVRRHGFGAREWFLVTWAAPPVLVYTLVHFGQAGYVLTFLPALVILLSHVLLVALGSPLAARPRRARGGGRGGRHARRARERRRSSSARGRRRATSTRRAGAGCSRRRTRRSTGSSAGRPPRCASTRPSCRRSSTRSAGSIARGHRRRDGARQSALVSVAAPRDVLPRRVPDLRAARGQPCPPGYYAPRLVVGDGAGAGQRDPAARRRCKRLVWFVDHWSPTVGASARAARDRAPARPLPLRPAARPAPRRVRRVHVREGGASASCAPARDPVR